MISAKEEIKKKDKQAKGVEVWVGIRGAVEILDRFQETLC